tara:strand:- start:32344 stop:32766 length:423 start_codon:yes stop_codon:yes gene_type:complete
MSLPKEFARKHDRFHLVSPDELDGLDEHAERLEAILHKNCYVIEEDGELILIRAKQLVDRLNGLKIEIYPNEHPPPHFHLKSPKVDASFTIEDCLLLKGDISGKDHNKIRYWHNSSKDLLIEVWDSTRPYQCQVGKYTGT